MNALRQYILSVICASILVSLISDLAEKTSFKKLVKLVCSLFLTFVIVKPLIQIDVPSMLEWQNTTIIDAQHAAQTGVGLFDQSVSDIIKMHTETYIQTEAKALGIDLEVEVIIAAGNTMVPDRVYLSGQYDSASQAELSRIISQELGIPKEHQIWGGLDQNKLSDS